MVFSHLGFWSGNLFLIAPFPDLCLLIPCSAVTQCGHLSPFFKLGRGCRQGDPISPYLFILCAEILSIRLRNNKNIKGIKIGNIELKFSQYADDASAFLDGSKTSLEVTLQELGNFANISGLKTNFDKTQVVWIGAKKKQHRGQNKMETFMGNNLI